MTNELQRATVTGIVTANPNHAAGWQGDAQNEGPAQVAEPPLPDGAPARLSVEVCDGHEQRLRELENEVEALSKQLESVIMALSRTFGSGQAALQKVK